jgi:hypothetical protein
MTRKRKLPHTLANQQQNLSPNEGRWGSWGEVGQLGHSPSCEVPPQCPAWTGPSQSFGAKALNHINTISFYGSCFNVTWLRSEEELTIFQWKTSQHNVWLQQSSEVANGYNYKEWAKLIRCLETRGECILYKHEASDP